MARHTSTQHDGLVRCEARESSLARRDLAGRDLAVAWLRGYLTRSSRNDNRWESAIADLSSPELVAELAESGPNSVGLDRLSS